MTVYETVSSVLGSLYCGHSFEAANDAFIDRHLEIRASDFRIVDNLGLFRSDANDGKGRTYWGGANPSVADKYAAIVAERERDGKATFEAEQNLKAIDDDDSATSALKTMLLHGRKTR